MGTACTIHFYEGSVTEPEATVYRHMDGYPDTPHGVLAALGTFFAAVITEAPDDTRFGDPSYLAARFVVWQARRGVQGDGDLGSLNFLGVGIIKTGSRAGHYRYAVRCVRGTRSVENPLGFADLPIVTWEEEK